MYNELVEPPLSKGKKPTLDLIEKLNAISIMGPIGNKEYFKSLKENFQSNPPPTVSPATLNYTDISGYINSPDTSTIPTLFQTGPVVGGAKPTTMSQIDQLEGFYTSVNNSISGLVTDIRDYIWGKVSNYKTVATNASSIKTLAAGTETTVNAYVETGGTNGIKSMEVPDLVTAWNNYSSAKSTFLDTIDNALQSKQTTYSRLYNAYNSFMNLDSVKAINSTTLTALPPSTSVGSNLTINELKADNYALVNNYFGASGFLANLKSAVATRINNWEDYYVSIYDNLAPSVKSRYSYTDQITANSNEDALISYMNSIAGVTDAPSAGPAPATGITELITSSLQNEALKSVVNFYDYLIANLVVFTSLSDISVGPSPQVDPFKFTVPAQSYTIVGGTVTAPEQTNITLSSLSINASSTIQSLSNLQNAVLDSRNQVLVAQTRKRYDVGLEKLKSYAKDEFIKRTEEYKDILKIASTDLFTSVPSISLAFTANGTETVTDANFASKQFNYFINSATNLINGANILYTTLRTNNNFLFNTQIVVQNKPSRPNYATIVTPYMLAEGNTLTISTVDASGIMFTNLPAATFGSGQISNHSTSLQSDFVLNTYLNNTVYRIYDKGTVIRQFKTRLYEELNYRNRMIGLIWKTMFESTRLSPFNTGLTGPTTYPASWSDQTSLTDISGSFSTYRTGLNTYVGQIQGRIQTLLNSYKDLYNEYNTFRRSALRITESGAPAPSGYLASIPVIDNEIQQIPTAWPTPSQVDQDLSDVTNPTWVTLQNNLFAAANKYGSDGSSVTYNASASGANTTNLLPKLIGWTKTEVTDYIQKYGDRYSAEAPSISNLLAASPSIRTNTVNTSANDKASLAPSDLTAQSIRTRMSNYTTYTDQLLETIDLDAVYDLMLSYISLYKNNKNVMSVATENTLKNAFIPPLTAPIIMSNITDQILTDTTVITSGDYDLQTVTGIFNRYTKARRDAYSGLVGDLDQCKIDISGALTKFNSFYSTYNEFYTLAQGTGTWAREESATADTTVIPSVTYSDANAETLSSANDTIMARIASLVQSIVGKLKTFKLLIDANVGSGKKFEHNTIPASGYVIYSYKGIQRSLHTILNLNLSDLPDKVSNYDSYIDKCDDYIELLKNIPACVTKIDDYMTSLKGLIRTPVQNKISEFLGKYDKELREVLKQPGIRVDFELAATNVCVKPTGSSTSINCMDTSESTSGEQYNPSSEFTSGYPFTDYSTISSNSVTFTQLNAAQERYSNLIQRVGTLRGQLLGIKELRRNVKEYVQTYYRYRYRIYSAQLITNPTDSIYYKDLYKTFESDISGLKVYMPNITDLNFEGNSSFNNLEDDQLKNIFYPFAEIIPSSLSPTSSLSPSLSPSSSTEGSKYRTMLNLLAAGVIEKINNFKELYNTTNPTKRAAIEVRKRLGFFTTENDLLNISYADTDISSLQQSNVSWSDIDKLTKKYVMIGSNKGLYKNWKMKLMQEMHPMQRARQQKMLWLHLKQNTTDSNTIYLVERILRIFMIHRNYQNTND
jgi:hypothetical protein